MFDVDDRPKPTRRRRFLCQVSALAAAGTAAAQGNALPEAPVPTIALGEHRVTRLIVGCNPVCGYSYLGHHMDRHMKEYFTAERTAAFLRRCEQAGINAFQFSHSPIVLEALRTVREGGSAMHFICLHAGREGMHEMIDGTHPIAVAHHGGVTDRLFAEGKHEEVHDFVKAAHDQGILAGVSAHNPGCIRRIADEGWEVDFFMTCFYYLTRPKDPAGGPGTLAIGYHFYEDDPRQMAAVVRQVTPPCLAFKILGAGRRCASQQMVREAFRFAFENIKKTDGVIVGMYPRFFDEISANVGYTRAFGQTA